MDQSLTQVYFHLTSQTAYLQHRLAIHQVFFTKRVNLFDPLPFHRHFRIRPCSHMTLSTC